MKLSKKLFVCTFYHYHSIEKTKLNTLKGQLLAEGEIEKLRGLILISSEGINGTLVSSLKSLKRYLQFIKEITDVPIQARWQASHVWGFKKLRVKIKDEIIKSAVASKPSTAKETHLTPQEWEQALKRNPTVLDVRNDYEVQLGQFKNAVNLELNQFTEFSKKLKKSNLSKNKETLIYCTGGVRCEKLVTEMKKQGFKDVKQLQGGVLNYLTAFPHSQYQGECFVFDHRVAVDQNLKPSQKYKLCPHCGQPGDQRIHCVRCKEVVTICISCSKKKSYLKTCSKNCAYHYQMGHKLKKKKQRNDSPNASY